MNAGFANLTTLKAHLLGAALQPSIEFNDVIAVIGLGIAGMIENHCQRKFSRIVGETEIFPGDRREFLLTRFPIESVTKVEVKHTEASGWEEHAVNEFVSTVDLATGILHTQAASDVGRHDAQVRITYTGGFFWETKEPSDPGYPTAQPAGSAALAQALQLAWLMQCQEVWNKRDKLGLTIAEPLNARSKLARVEFAPLVAQMLRPFIREAWV